MRALVLFALLAAGCGRSTNMQGTVHGKNLGAATAKAWAGRTVLRDAAGGEQHFLSVIISQTITTCTEFNPAEAYQPSGSGVALRFFRNPIGSSAAATPELVPARYMARLPAVLPQGKGIERPDGAGVFALAFLRNPDCKNTIDPATPLETEAFAMAGEESFATIDSVDNNTNDPRGYFELQFAGGSTLRGEFVAAYCGEFDIAPPAACLPGASGCATGVAGCPDPAHICNVASGECETPQGCPGVACTSGQNGFCQCPSQPCRQRCGPSYPQNASIGCPNGSTCQTGKCTGGDCHVCVPNALGCKDSPVPCASGKICNRNSGGCETPITCADTNDLNCEGVGSGSQQGGLCEATSTPCRQTCGSLDCAPCPAGTSCQACGGTQCCK